MSRTTMTEKTFKCRGGCGGEYSVDFLVSIKGLAPHCRTCAVDVLMPHAVETKDLHIRRLSAASAWQGGKLVAIERVATEWAESEVTPAQHMGRRLLDIIHTDEGNAATTDAVFELRRDLEETRKQYAELLAANTLLSQHAASASHRAGLYKTVAKRARRDRARLKTRADAAERAVHKSAGLHLTEVRGLESERDEWRAKCEAAEQREKESAGNAYIAITRAESEAASLRARLDVVGKELLEALDARDSARAEVKRLRNSVELEKILGRWDDKERAKLAAAAFVAASLRADNIRQAREISEWMAYNERLKSEAASLRAELQSEKDRRVEHRQMNQSLNEQVQRLRAELDAANKQAEIQAESLREARAEVERLRTEYLTRRHPGNSRVREAELTARLAAAAELARDIKVFGFTFTSGVQRRLDELASAPTAPTGVAAAQERADHERAVLETCESGPRSVEDRRVLETAAALSVNALEFLGTDPRVEGAPLNYGELAALTDFVKAELQRRIQAADLDLPLSRTRGELAEVSVAALIKELDEATVAGEKARAMSDDEREDRYEAFIRAKGWLKEGEKLDRSRRKGPTRFCMKCGRNHPGTENDCAPTDKAKAATPVSYADNLFMPVPGSNVGVLRAVTEGIIPRLVGLTVHLPLPGQPHHESALDEMLEALDVWRIDIDRALARRRKRDVFADPEKHIGSDFGEFMTEQRDIGTEILEGLRWCKRREERQQEGQNKDGDALPMGNLQADGAPEPEPDERHVLPVRRLQESVRAEGPGDAGDGIRGHTRTARGHPVEAGGGKDPRRGRG